MHSSFVSDVELYEAQKNEEALTQPASGLLTRAHFAASPQDKMLDQWLKDGKAGAGAYRKCKRRNAVFNGAVEERQRGKAVSATPASGAEPTEDERLAQSLSRF